LKNKKVDAFLGHSAYSKLSQLKLWDLLSTTNKPHMHQPWRHSQLSMKTTKIVEDNSGSSVQGVTRWRFAWPTTATKSTTWRSLVGLQSTHCKCLL